MNRAIQPVRVSAGEIGVRGDEAVGPGDAGELLIGVVAVNHHFVQRIEIGEHLVVAVEVIARDPDAEGVCRSDEIDVIRGIPKEIGAEIDIGADGVGAGVGNRISKAVPVSANKRCGAVGQHVGNEPVPSGLGWRSIDRTSLTVLLDSSSQCFMCALR